MRKRICSMLLLLAMLVALFPTALGADAVTINPNVNMGTATPAQSAYFSSAYVRNKGGTATSNGTARNIEAVVNLKSYGGKHTVYATVMKRTDYSKYAADLVNGIQSGGYFKLGNVADIQRYAIGRANPLNDGSAAVLPLVEASTASDSTLGSGGTVANKSMPAATISGQHYFDEYALVVFSEDATTGNSYYYVDFFYIDADGYVATPSYLVRYNDNNPTQGTGSVSGTPARTIQRAVEKTGVPGATTLSTAEPVRVGYTFQGWSGTAAGAVEYGKGTSFPQPAPLYKAYDLYAVWKNIPIQFETITGSKDQTITDEVRVGVSGTWTFKLDSTSDSRSTKTFTVTQITVKGTPVTDAVKYPGNIPAGLSIRLNGNMGWTLSGTPKYDCTDPIVMTVKVTDVANATTDEMQLTIPQIKRGLQPMPDLTVTTGLSTTMVDDADESTNDGRLIGFYAIGQPSKVDSANASMTDGTGTYTNYYLTKGMIYEYRPAGDENALWREIPAPEKLYSGLTPEQKTAFLASLEAGAITRCKTTITSKTAATYEAQPDDAAWDATYGAIQFVDGAPVVTGLAKDAVYEVRFRESATFDASTAVTITVGGSSGGGGPADPSDFASITFYDWDETLLGSIVVPKGADASVDVQAFTDARVAEADELDPKYLWYSDEKMESDKADPAKMPKYFSNKKGYDFDAWLLNDSATFTANDSALPKYDGANDAEAAAAGVADFRTMEENLTVKASYKANETLNRTAYDETGKVWSGTNISYTFSDPSYARYGNSTTDRAGTYGIKVTALRENNFGFGVTRLEEPAIRATMVTDTELTGSAVTIYTLSSLVNQDYASAEIAPTKMIAQVTYAVLDQAATNSWPTANTASANKIEKKNAGTIGSNGFVKFGTLAFINQQAVLVRAGEANNWSWVNAKAFEDAGLSTQSAGNVNEAKSRISKYFNNHPDVVELSYTELQDVIDNKLN